MHTRRYVLRRPFCHFSSHLCFVDMHGDLQFVTMEDVVGEIDIFTSATGNFTVIFISSMCLSEHACQFRERTVFIVILCKCWSSHSNVC